MRFHAIHPDGRRIVFDSGANKESEQELWVVENLLADTEKRAAAGAK